MAKKIKMATRGITEEFRAMDVGEVVEFPLSKYKYTSVRATQAGSLVLEQIEEGKRWTTRLDKEHKCVYVTRVS